MGGEKMISVATWNIDYWKPNKEQRWDYFTKKYALTLPYFRNVCRLLT